MSIPIPWMPTIRATAFPCEFCGSVWDNRVSAAWCCDILAHDLGDDS